MAYTIAPIKTERLAAVVQRRNLKKGLYLIPSLFTIANIGMGFFAVIATLHSFQIIGQGEAEISRATVYLDAAAKAIGWAVLFDTLDGRIARMTKTTTEIGVQLDSIADMLTFGIAPVVLVYAWGYGNVFNESSTAINLAWFVSFMYVISGAFRLARFNIQATRPRPLAEGSTKVDKRSFVGLPIPAAAGLLAAIVHFAPTPLIRQDAEKSVFYSGMVMLLVAVLSLLMISTIRYTSFKSVGETPRSTRFALVILAALVMLIWLFSQEVLLAITVTYVAHGIILQLTSLLRRKKQETVS